MYFMYFLSDLGGQSAGVSGGHDEGSSVVPMEVESIIMPKKRPRSSSGSGSSENKKNREFKRVNFYHKIHLFCFCRSG